eukprot:2697586-Prymnesium_polylepis.1
MRRAFAEHVASAPAAVLRAGASIVRSLHAVMRAPAEAEGASYKRPPWGASYKRPPCARAPERECGVRCVPVAVCRGGAATPQHGPCRARLIGGIACRVRDRHPAVPPKAPK